MGAFFKILILLLFSWRVNASQGVLLDKITAVFNEKVITLSQLKRIQKNIPAIKKISPRIYRKRKYTIKELAVLRVRHFLIREELSRIGYVVGNEQVEEQIKESEKQLGINRKQLLSFLKQNKMSFDEYFELTREWMEYKIFTSRIITPLISVTEQEVKNVFHKKNKAKGKTSAFKYNLVNFSLEKRFMTKKMLPKFPDAIKKLQTNGILPEKFSKVQTNVLGDITEEGLTKNVIKILKSTPEGSLTPPVLLGSDYHVFLIRKKSLVESEVFMSAKRDIQSSLAEKSATKIVNDWFKRQKEKHYIKYSF